MENYREIVNRIVSLNWSNLTQTSLEQLMFLSLETAKEFARSLRAALDLYPKDILLQSMATEELMTDNLRFDGYYLEGDHWMFLDHFLQGMIPAIHMSAACAMYRRAVEEFDPRICAMSIFSRELELPGIFVQILAVPVWQQELPKHLQSFQYYLERHVALDSQEGGHGDLVKHYEITEDVRPFYEARLKLYLDALPDLGTKKDDP